MYNKELIAAVGAAVVVLQTGTVMAEREGEIGGFAGGHLYDGDRPLGVAPLEAGSLDNAFTFGIRAAFALNYRFDVEGELAISPTETTASGDDVVSLGWRAHALMHFMDEKFRPFAVLGAGGLTLAPNDSGKVSAETHLALHAGVGAKYAIEENWGLRFDARLLVLPSGANDSMATDGEILFALYKSFGKSAEPIQRKAPEPDRDGDGIADKNDRCPNRSVELGGNPNGCPKQVVSSNGDRDGDGIRALDKCPLKPEDFDGFQDEDGCPEENDGDGDGVVDRNDKCPFKAETKNGYKDSDGCPDTLPKAAKEFSGKIAGIQFQTDSATLLAKSLPTLRKAVAVLKQYPSLHVEIQGHTDNQGAEQRNRRLSQSRAQAVVDFFVRKGIEPSRFTAKGFGASIPLGNNATPGGRSKNRRVEFQFARK